MCFACLFAIFFVSLKHETEGTDSRGNGNACTLLVSTQIRAKI